MLAACLVAFAPMEMKAQKQVTDTITGKVHVIDEVTVSTTGRSRNVISTAPTQLVTQKQLLYQGVTDLSDALRRFSGVNVRDYGGAGGVKTISVRSLGSQHTAVAYDGITITDAQSGQIDLSRFSLDNIRSLSLTIGDNDDIFLPARTVASAAVLRLQTEVPDFAEKTYRLKAEVKTGSFGMLNPYLRYDQQLGQKVSLSAYADYLRADNQYPFRLVNGKYVTTEKRNNNFIETYRGELNLTAHTSQTGLLQAKAYYYNSFRELPGPVILYNSVNREKETDRNFFAQLHYQTLLGSMWHLQLNGKFNWTYTHYQDTGNQYPGGMLSNYYYQREYYGSGTLMFTPDDHWAIAYAADYAYNNFNSNTTAGVRPYRNTILQTLTAKYQSKQWLLTARLLASIYDNGAKYGAASKSANRLSPSISLSFKPFEHQDLYLRASYKDIFRVATFSENYYARFSSRDVNPEIARQYNVGITYNMMQPGAWLQNFNITVDGYYNKVKDKIVAVPFNMFFWTIINLGRVDIWGTDLNVDATFRLAKNHQLLFNAAYTLQRAANMTDPKSAYYKNQIVYTPKNSGSASLAWENPWVNLALHTTMSSARYTVEDHKPSNRLPGYGEWGASLYRSFSFRSFEVVTRLDGINLGNKQYSIVKSYPMPGRSFKFTISVTI
ncbi:MAG: TonB-dependent receptor [Bacteroidaceae bacterium]|nr:TonB-dependent receptor [Bacteroidaceae bacterium]